MPETSDEVSRDFWLATSHRDGVPPRLGPSTQTTDKFVQLVLAGQVVGLAEASAQHAFVRPGIRFVPVPDVEPVSTALAWRPDTPNLLVDVFLAIAREPRRPPADQASVGAHIG